METRLREETAANWYRAGSVLVVLRVAWLQARGGPG